MKIFIVQANDFQKASKEIKFHKEKNSLIVVESTNYDITKKILERHKADILLVPLLGKKDKMKQLDSGFDSVLARICKKNNVALGINLEEFFKSKSFKEKSNIISRIKQNIKLCNKYKISIVFFSERKRDLYDLKAFCIVLGLQTFLVKNINFYKIGINQ
ncbi:MAG: hypothetical protein KatS3mg001_124 [Candidatus Pacearchaeota archaeon]|nr:MAG: hypothetical protein KatS3mg001_124 [Candidatus Pacearchaeota archaeon]